MIFRPSFRVAPDSIFKHLVPDITATRSRPRRIGSDFFSINSVRVKIHVFNIDT